MIKQEDYHLSFWADDIFFLRRSSRVIYSSRKEFVAELTLGGVERYEREVGDEFFSRVH